VKRTFIDANILLEVLLNRRLAEQCLAILNDPSKEYGISALTVHIVWYIAEKYRLDRDRVDETLSPWEILPIANHTLKTARSRYDGKDFEDCLQAACAEEGGYDEIATIDKNFQRHSGTILPVAIISQ
jgi:predicted nucleic acid-binding protein